MQRDTEEPSLIARRLLFGNPEKMLALLSSDGSKLSYLAPVDGVLNVWVGPADRPRDARPVTGEKVRGVPGYCWAHTSEHLLYWQDTDGDENWHLYAVDLRSGAIRDLTPIPQVQARIEMLSRRTTTKIVIGLNDRDPKAHDFYVLDIESGERTLLVRNDESFVGLLCDLDLAPRVTSRMTSDGGEQYLLREAGAWKPFFEVGLEDSASTRWLEADGRHVTLIDSRQRNTGAVKRFDTISGRFELLAEDPRAEPQWFLVHPTERRLQAVAFNYERVAWKVLDPAIAADIELLSGFLDADFHVVSRTTDDRFWMIAFHRDANPVHYYRYDREARRLHFLFSNHPELDATPLVQMRPVVIPSRDGLDLVSYLSLPADRDRDGRPDEPLPMALVVHGGPWGRDVWANNATHQWLANRGYAVLSVNFRASTGFGKAFTNAGNRERGAAMHDDLLDAVDWSVREGIARRDAIAIMGGSYGGYATLVGLTFTPEVFACGIDLVGPSNLVTLLESIPPYWAPQLELFASRVGDPRTPEGREFLASRSPLTFADRIRRPLLIAQGANDPRVKRSESDQIVHALQAKGIPVTYVSYPDEGHGFQRPENRLSFNAIAEAFLSRCLGGRCEPVGDDFAGSSVTILAGAEYLPGLNSGNAR